MNPHGKEHEVKMDEQVSSVLLPGIDGLAVALCINGLQTASQLPNVRPSFAPPIGAEAFAEYAS